MLIQYHLQHLMTSQLITDQYFHSCLETIVNANLETGSFFHVLLQTCFTVSVAYSRHSISCFSVSCKLLPLLSLAGSV